MRVWVPKLFPSIQLAILANNQFVDLFELVSPEDYAENFDPVLPTDIPRRRDTATVVRIVGRAVADLVVPAPGANGIQWAAAIFVRSRQSVVSEFIHNPSNFMFHINAIYASPASFTTNMTRLNPLQWLPDRSYSGAFRPNPGGGCSEFFSDINRPQEIEWDFDISQRRRLSGDEALYMAISGIVGCDLEPDPTVFLDCAVRTLIHDD